MQNIAQIAQICSNCSNVPRFLPPAFFCVDRIKNTKSRVALISQNDARNRLKRGAAADHDGPAPLFFSVILVEHFGNRLRPDNEILRSVSDRAYIF